MGNNENLTGVPSMKWYKIMICAIIPLGALVDMFYIALYTISVMSGIPIIPTISPISFLFIFLTAFCIFFRLISCILLTGRISAGPKTLIGMYIVQVVYSVLYYIFLLYEGGFVFDYLMCIALLPIIPIRIALMIINISYFNKRKTVFCR